MSISAYEFLSIVQTKSAGAEPSVKGNYKTLLEFVRNRIAAKHSETLADVLESKEAARALRELILKYTTEYMEGEPYDKDTVIERLYQDMAGLGVLTQYIYDPNVEEINVNGWDSIEILTGSGTTYLTGDQAFDSADNALAIIKRMVRMGGKLLDAQTPEVDSNLGSGTRISAMIPPLIPSERGVTASIRKQNKARITSEQMIEAETATPEMLEFLSMCLCNGVSIGIAGGTGSGKTTLQAYLLNDYIMHNDDHNNRIYMIEDSREITTLDWDDQHNRPARVIYTQTSPPPRETTMRDQIKNALRYNPAIIVPAEVRDGAALEAANAGLTGHTILTSFHANGTIDGYTRLVGMCHMSNTTLSDERLYDMCVRAWPIIVFQRQLKDHSRRIMEIYEAVGYENGKVKGTPLYKFQASKVVRDKTGKIIKVEGSHKRVGCISDNLATLLYNNGVEKERITRLFPTALIDGGVMD